VSDHADYFGFVTGELGDPDSRLGNPAPSSWLLNSEPDLTPNQVWRILGTPDHGRSIRNGVAIADSAEQASQVVSKQYQ
jgi:hypothetical protein